MSKRRSSQYLEAFQRHLEDHMDHVPHANPNRRGIDLDPHQRDGVRAIVSAIESHRRRISRISSCGSGKTLEEIAIISASQAAKEELGINGNRKDLLVTDGRAPVNGIVSQCRNLGLQTGIWAGGERNLDPPVIIANIQSLVLNRALDTLDDHLPPSDIDLTIIDEADTFLTGTRLELINDIDPRTLIGFTATDEWPDGRNLSSVFGRPVHEMRLREGIRRRVNALPEFLLYESDIEEDSIRIRGGDYDESSLASALKEVEIHRAIPEIYDQVVPRNARREWPTLIMVPSINLVHDVTQTMQLAYRDITTVGWSGDQTTTRQMNEDMDRFKQGDIQIIVSCEMGGRGMNLENAVFMLDGYPCGSLNKLEQRHGRILRRIRPGSELWKQGWRKTQAVIAQVVPRSNRFRPALFTDIIGGYRELQLLHQGGVGNEESGAPQTDIIADLRRRIERGRPMHNLTLLQQLDAYELLSRRQDIPTADEQGFFRYRRPRRFTRANS